MVTELRSELKLIEAAIRALERFANAIGIEEDAAARLNRSGRSTPQRNAPPSDQKPGAD